MSDNTLNPMESKKPKYVKAFELCQENEFVLFKVKGGRVVWEAISYRDSDRCVISRVVKTAESIFCWG